MPQKIRGALEGSELLVVLERECLEPRSLAEVAAALKASFQDKEVPADQELTPEEWRTLAEAYLLIGSIGRDSKPAVPSFAR